MMKNIELPVDYNYIGVFLTLGCNLSCSYCINHTVGLDPKRKHLNSEQWLIALSRLTNLRDVPITLQGGEPTIHPGFLDIMDKLNKKVDLLTNLQFDIEKFVDKVPVEIFNRELPYPAIRVSYHPEQVKLNELKHKVIKLHELGYPIGVFSVEHPKYMKELHEAQSFFDSHQVIFKYKDLLAELNGKVFGEYKYPGACFSKELKSCMCKTSELLIAPDGSIYRCHHDLYNAKMPIGNILDPEFVIEDKFRECTYFGQCNPCDIKLKNNRYQEFGHCSVTIESIS